MGSGVGAGAMLTGHEPGIPGGETPPSTAGGTPAATEARFMESPLFKNDLLSDHEPGEAEGRLRRRLRLRLRGEPRFVGKAWSAATPARSASAGRVKTIGRHLGTPHAESPQDHPMDRLAGFGMTGPSFGHLAAAGIASAKDRHVHFLHWRRHNSTGSSFRICFKFRASSLMRGCSPANWKTHFKADRTAGGAWVPGRE